jgi:hypothetical protein
MPDYTSPRALQAINPASFLAGYAHVPAALAQLQLQSNSLNGGAGSPLIMVQVPPALATKEATIELPAMPGLRSVAYGSCGTDGLSGVLSDETGALISLSFGGGDAWVVDHWHRPEDGWMTLRLSVPGPAVSTGGLLTVAPIPTDQSDHGQEEDLYACDRRTDANRGVSVRLMSLMAQSVWQAWQRPLVHYTLMDLTGQRATAAATEVWAANLVILGRNRPLGMSVQAAGSAAAEVELTVGSAQCSCTGFPAVQGNIIRSAASTPVIPGIVTGILRVTVPPAGTLDVYSISIYER